MPATRATLTLPHLRRGPLPLPRCGRTPTGPDEPGYAAGAPQRPLLLRKLLLTTAVAGVIWLGIYIVVSEPWLSFRGS